MEEVAAFLVPITLFVVVGGVVLLRPITSRMGMLLEAIAQQKRGTADLPDMARQREVIAALESRIALLEERQNFTESLLTEGSKRRPVEVLSAGARSDGRS